MGALVAMQLSDVPLGHMHTKLVLNTTNAPSVATFAFWTSHLLCFKAVSANKNTKLLMLRYSSLAAVIQCVISSTLQYNTNCVKRMKTSWHCR